MNIKEINLIARIVRKTKPRPQDFHTAAQSMADLKQWKDTIYTFASNLTHEHKDFDFNAFVKKCGEK